MLGTGAQSSSEVFPRVGMGNSKSLGLCKTLIECHVLHQVIPVAYRKRNRCMEMEINMELECRLAVK